QAARVFNYTHDVPLQRQFTSVENFRKMYEGKKCNALIQEVNFDVHDMPTVNLKRLQLGFCD
ncbi:unnamed protein product, partial [Allacma fusca]